MSRPHDGGNGFAITLPGGVSMGGRGIVAILALVLMVLATSLGVLIYLIHLHLGAIPARLDAIEAARGQQIAAAIRDRHREHAQIAEWIKALVYIGLASESERQRLFRRMDVPPMLAEPGRGPGDR